MSVSFVILLSVLSSIAHRGKQGAGVAGRPLHLGANSFMVGVLAALYAGLSLLSRCTRAGSPTASACATRSARFGRHHRGPRPSGAAGRACLPLFSVPALIGLGQIFFHVSIHNAVGSNGDPADRAKNFSTFSLGGSVATFIGPSLAGFTIDALGFPADLRRWLAAISFAVVLLALAFPRLVPPRGGHHDENRSGARSTCSRKLRCAAR